MLWYGWWGGFDRLASAVRPFKMIPHIVIALLTKQQEGENGKREREAINKK